MSLSKSVKQIVLAIGFCLSGVAFSDLEWPNFQYGQQEIRTYQGKITVINRSNYQANVGIHGENCAIKAWIPSSNPQEVGHYNTYAHSCQELLMRHGEARTFYLDEANVKGSNKLWIEMNFPSAASPSTRWVCFDRITRRYINLSGDTLSRHGSVTVEIMEDFRTLQGSMKCQITYP